MTKLYADFRMIPIVGGHLHGNYVCRPDPIELDRYLYFKESIALDYSDLYAIKDLVEVTLLHYTEKLHTYVYFDLTRFMPELPGVFVEIGASHEDLLESINRWLYGDVKENPIIFR